MIGKRREGASVAGWFWLTLALVGLGLLFVSKKPAYRALPASDIEMEKMAADPSSPQKNSQSVTLGDEGGSITGQMARIPANGDIVSETLPDAKNNGKTDAKAASEVDKDTSRDLLSIINKY